MSDRFACPQCGFPIVMPPYALGRHLNCPECQTLVELPYLTRKVKPRRRQPLPGWAAVIITFCLAIIMAHFTYRMVLGRVKSERQNTLKQILLLVDEDERSGRADAAVRRLDAALQLVSEPGVTSAGEADAIRSRRDRLAAAQLEITQKLALENAEADLVVAGSLMRAPLPDPAALFDLCDRVLKSLQSLDTPRALAARQKAENLAGQIIEQRGIVIEPPRGAFAYEPDTVTRQAGLGAALHTILVGRGYVPPRESSPLTPLWNQSAPFRLAIELKETRADKYMSSVLDTFLIVAELQFSQAGTLVWKHRLEGRTRQPCPTLPARLSGVLAIRKTKDLESERLFFDDAAAQLISELSKATASLPAYAPGQPTSPGR